MKMKIKDKDDGFEDFEIEGKTEIEVERGS